VTRQVPIAYPLAFSCIFDCPVGALIDYAGTPKSPYHSPTMGRVTESKEHYRPWSRS
jgi:hypothetical protein